MPPESRSPANCSRGIADAVVRKGLAMRRLVVAEDAIEEEHHRRPK
jgi:hypothetical protein